MAWYKDPQTGEMVKVDLFEKPDNQLNSMKVPQSTIMVVPFNTPYRTMDLEADNPEATLNDVYRPLSTKSASKIAQEKAASALMRGLLPAWAWGGEGNFIAAESWLPWNMSVDPENSNSLYNVIVDVAVSSLTLNDELPDAGVLPMNRNPTRYKLSNQVDQFNKPAPPSLADPLRASANVSYLAEKSPNGTLTAGASHAFNKYDVHTLKDFSNENSQAWKEGLYSNSVSPKDSNDALSQDQYKSRLTLMEERVRLESRVYPPGPDNAFFNNLMFSPETPMVDEDKWAKLDFKHVGGFFQGNGIVVPSNYGARSYRDATFEIKKPFLENAYQANLNESVGLSSPVNIQAHYNFYLLPYEKAISDYPQTNNLPIKVPLGGQKTMQPIPEPQLPNIYALIYDQISDEKYFRYYDQGSWLPPSVFKYCKKENGNLHVDDPQKEMYPFTAKFLDNTLSQFLGIGTKKQHIDEGPVKNIADYLNGWATTMGEVNKPAPEGTPAGPGAAEQAPAYKKYKTKQAVGALFSSLGSVKGSKFSSQQKKYNVVGVSAYKTKDFFDEASKLKKMFPFYVDINLPMANSGYVGETLYKAGLTDIFMQNVMAAMYTVSNQKSLQNNVSVPIFYDNLNIAMSTALNEACVIRKDNQMLQGDVQPEQNTMFNETLLHLWLNDVLESNILLDLDASPADKDDALAGASTMQSHQNYFAGLPPQYYDWMHSDGSGADYIEQIKKFKGGIMPNDVSVLKPVIFGKAPPKTAGGAMAFLKWAAAKTKINKFINERVRSVKDIYQGKKAHSEVLFYEVVKYKAWTDSSTEEAPYWPGNSVGKSEEQKMGENFSYAPISGPKPGKLNEKTKSFIQSFFIPNVPGLDIANYVDTQVKHDKGYYYQVYAHTFVVGTQYQNTSIETELQLDPVGQTLSNPAKVDMSYLYKPDVHLIRVPYYNTIASANNTVYTPETETDTYNSDYFLTSLETTLVWDKPPIFPDVSFVPLQGETGKVLINCNFNIGQYDLYPITIDTVSVAGVGGNQGKTHILMNRDEEVAQIKSRISQRKIKGPITYSGDDFCGRIEILRTAQEPKSYGAFSPTSDHLIASVGDGMSNLGYIDDTLISNKNYYYIFREVDSHGNYSNPSPVYMVRIVDKDGEAPYSIFKMFFIEDLQNKKSNNPLKSFMKYIRIGPSPENLTLDEDALINHKAGAVDLVGTTKLDEMIGDPDLQKSAWGRTFKFRFTSKKTGKKFDLNLRLKDIAKLQKLDESSSGEPDTYKSGKC